MSRARELRFVHFTRPYGFVAPFQGEHVLLLQVADAATTPEEREGICRGIVASRCRYVLCRGHDCELWHDWIDAAAVHAEIGAAERGGSERPFLMTTWHAEEPLEDTLEFFLLFTACDDFGPHAFAVVQVGGLAEDLAALERAIRALDRENPPL